MQASKHRIGLIVNPIAGLGGSVGLKGTDDMVQQALARGAVPMAQGRTTLALQALRPLGEQLELLTFSGTMGGDCCNGAQLAFTSLGTSREQTSQNDTCVLAHKLLDEGVELILFAGGDGTARDVCSVIGEEIPAIGIPAGVKIHSPVYAKKPQDAGALAAKFLTESLTCTSTEVLDIDEQAYRREIIATRLYGYLLVPTQRQYTQNRKAPTPLSEQGAIMSIAHQIVEDMQPDTYYLIGAGSTTAGIMKLLDLPYTLIGVDLICNRQIVAQDVYGAQILSLLADKPTKLVLSVTGGQGFLLGRGNQQLTPAVLRRVGRENIIVVSSKQKLFALQGQPLFIDTSDPALDAQLAGYWKVITSYHEQVMCQVQ